MVVTVRGKVRKVYFRDPDTDFYIFLADDTQNPRQAPIKMKGHFFSPRIYQGVEIEVRGEWEVHPKYGRTLVVSESRPITDTREARAHYMVAQLPSLGALNAQRILEYLGDGPPDPFDIIDQNPDILYEVPRIPEGLIAVVIREWREAREFGNVASALMSMGVPTSAIKKVFTEYGDATLDIIRNNPYALALVEGITFKQADKIALGQGFSPDSDFRIASILEYMLEVASKQRGHLYLEKESMVTALNRLPRTERVAPFGRVLGQKDLDKALEDRVNKDRVKIDANRVYLAWNHYVEEASAQMLAQLATPHNLGIDTDSFIAEYERIYKIKFSEEQEEAIKALNENKVLLLTGLPGTGKSTVSKALVRLFKRTGKKFMLMSPTGIAAKRLATVVGEEAGTIHRSLGYTVDGEWKYGEDNKLNVEAVLVDEVSMLDQTLLYRLLQALKPETILVLVGDNAQLPSVGAGNVLYELVSSEAIKRVHLTQIYRQEGASDIILNAHRINRGEELVISDPTKKQTDFRFVEMDSPKDIIRAIQHVVKKLYDSQNGITYQVLSPTYKGHLGVSLLNEVIKEMINPIKFQQEIVLGQKTFREEDRVIVVKNNYKLHVFNGEVGKIYQIDRRKKKVRVKLFDTPEDRLVEMTYDQARTMLMLAYAMTIHRVQGQEFDYVVMPFHEQFSIQLQRNLLYTAVTRAKKKVFIFGQWKALSKAIRNDEVARRNTWLSQRIEEAFREVAQQDGWASQMEGGRV